MNIFFRLIALDTHGKLMILVAVRIISLPKEFEIYKRYQNLAVIHQAAKFHYVAPVFINRVEEYFRG